MKLRVIIILSLVLGSMLSLSACASAAAQVSPDTTAEELIQRGQEASEKRRYSLALEYYEMVLDRFPSNIDKVCAAEYEIAHIHYKQKKYDTARKELRNLMDRYKESDGELLPPQFKRLAEIVLQRIDQQTGGISASSLSPKVPPIP